MSDFWASFYFESDYFASYYFAGTRVLAGNGERGGFLGGGLRLRREDLDFLGTPYDFESEEYKLDLDDAAALKKELELIKFKYEAQNIRNSEAREFYHEKIKKLKRILRKALKRARRKLSPKVEVQVETLVDQDDIQEADITSEDIALANQDKITGLRGLPISHDQPSKWDKACPSFVGSILVALGTYYLVTNESLKVLGYGAATSLALSGLKKLLS